MGSLVNFMCPKHYPFVIGMIVGNFLLELFYIIFFRTANSSNMKIESNTINTTILIDTWEKPCMIEVENKIGPIYSITSLIELWMALVWFKLKKDMVGIVLYILWLSTRSSYVQPIDFVYCTTDSQMILFWEALMILSKFKLNFSNSDQVHELRNRIVIHIITKYILW